MTPPRALYAFYDLSVSPATFDLIVFLILAEIEREKRGLSYLHPVIVPGDEHGFRTGDLGTYHRIGAVDYDAESLRWRLRNLLMPCCSLLPSCREITVCGSRREAGDLLAHLAPACYPRGYDVANARANYGWRVFLETTRAVPEMPSLRATQQALRFVAQWQRGITRKDRLITLTLRECDYEPDRNSNLPAWVALARELQKKGYCPVILRDVDAAFGPVPSLMAGIPVFSEASWNMEIRAALYERSYLNMFVNNGPAALCMFNRHAHGLVFKMITESCGATSTKFFQAAGIEPGMQLPHFTPCQKWVWKDDTIAVLREEFYQMVDRIEEKKDTLYPLEAL